MDKFYDKYNKGDLLVSEPFEDHENGPAIALILGINTCSQTGMVEYSVLLDGELYNGIKESALNLWHTA